MNEVDDLLEIIMRMDAAMKRSEEISVSILKTLEDLESVENLETRANG